MTDSPRLPRSKFRAKLLDRWNEAHDFDPADPMVGLSRHDLSGPVIERRTVLRLLAASGALTAAHLLPGVGARPVRAAAGGTLRAGGRRSESSGPSIRPRSIRCFCSRSRPMC